MSFGNSLIVQSRLRVGEKRFSVGVPSCWRGEPVSTPAIGSPRQVSSGCLVNGVFRVLSLGFDVANRGGGIVLDGRGGVGCGGLDLLQRLLRRFFQVLGDLLGGVG